MTLYFVIPYYKKCTHCISHHMHKITVTFFSEASPLVCLTHILEVTIGTHASACLNSMTHGLNMDHLAVYLNIQVVKFLRIIDEFGAGWECGHYSDSSTYSA